MCFYVCNCLYTESHRKYGNGVRLGKCMSFNETDFKMEVINRICVSITSIRNALELSGMWRVQYLWRAGMLVLWLSINFHSGMRIQKGDLSSLIDVYLSVVTKTNTSTVTLLNCNVAIYSLNLHVILASRYNTGDSYFTLVICCWKELCAIWKIGNLTRMP